jgi:hypothetical protein
VTSSLLYRVLIRPRSDGFEGSSARRVAQLDSLALALALAVSVGAPDGGSPVGPPLGGVPPPPVLVAVESTPTVMQAV